MDLTEATSWAAERQTGALITIRRDGRAQSSDITYTVVGPVFVISLTDTRAKTKNMRRDPRVVLHVSSPSSFSYVSFDGTVSLSPTATSVDDATCDALVKYYEAVRGEAHPDWDEYRQAMVDDQRLIASFTPTTAVGQIHRRD